VTLKMGGVGDPKSVQPATAFPHKLPMQMDPKSGLSIAAFPHKLPIQDWKEMLTGDPWAGCNDLAREGLSEWCADFFRSGESFFDWQVEQCAELLLDRHDSQPSNLSADHLPVDKMIPTRSSLGTASTASSMGSSGSWLPRRPASSCTSSAGSSVHSDERFLESTEDDEVFSANAEVGPGDDWELEFMLRAAMDTKDDDRGEEPGSGHGNKVQKVVRDVLTRYPDGSPRRACPPATVASDLPKRLQPLRTLLHVEPLPSELSLRDRRVPTIATDRTESSTKAFASFIEQSNPSRTPTLRISAAPAQDVSIDPRHELVRQARRRSLALGTR